MNRQLEELIAKSSNIVFFGGAGVSTDIDTKHQTRESPRKSLWGLVLYPDCA